MSEFSYQLRLLTSSDDIVIVAIQYHLADCLP